MSPLIIYHGPSCTDGWCAFYIAHQHFASQGVEVEGIAAQYGQSPPDVAGRDVYVLDFSYPREQLERMAAVAKSIVVLDHHKTAQEALEGLSCAHFDMDRSGARMAWDYFHPGEEAPPLVAYVEDNDLWRHRLPDTEAINLYIQQVPKTIEDWVALEMASLNDLIRQGESMLRIRDSYVEMLIPCALEKADGDIRYWKVNAPQFAVSQLLNRLCQIPFADGTYPAFAESWQDTPTGRKHSLRSAVNPSYPEAFDVSAYVKQYGGGGHHCAAGYRS